MRFSSEYRLRKFRICISCRDLEPSNVSPNTFFRWSISLLPFSSSLHPLSHQVLPNHPRNHLGFFAIPLFLLFVPGKGDAASHEELISSCPLTVRLGTSDLHVSMASKHRRDTPTHQYHLCSSALQRKDREEASRAPHQSSTIS